MLLGSDATIWEERHLEPALVAKVEECVELLRVARVNEHRELETGGRLPDGIEVGIVERQARAVRLTRRLAKAFSDLANAHGPRGHVRLELSHRAFRPPRAHV